MSSWKHYVEIHNDTKEIMAYHYARPTPPEAQLPTWTVYEIKVFPDEYEYYCDGLVFDTETGTLMHTQKSKNILYRRYLSDTDWYVIRSIEIGTAIPQKVSEKRAYARANIVD